MEEHRLIHHRACRVTSCGRELATYRARRESGMGRKQREALGLIPEFAAGTGPRRVKEQFGQKARVRFVSVSTSRVVLYTVSGASAPCTPAVLLATLAGALSGLGESSTRTRAAWNPDVLTLQRHSRQRPREPSSAHCCVPSGLHPTMFSYYAATPPSSSPLQMFTACQLHYPPSSFFHSPRAGVSSAEFLLSTFANSVANKREPELAWNVSPEREKLLCLPTRTGLKAVWSDSASASPEENLKGTTKRDTRHSARVLSSNARLVRCLPSFPRTSPSSSLPRDFFRLPTFAPIPPTSSTASRDERVTSRSADRWSSWSWFGSR